MNESDTELPASTEDDKKVPFLQRLLSTEDNAPSGPGSKAPSTPIEEPTEEDAQLAADLVEGYARLREEVGKFIVGQERVVEEVVTAVFAGGLLKLRWKHFVRNLIITGVIALLSVVGLRLFFSLTLGDAYDKDETLALAPGTYGKLKVKEGGTLILSSGAYVFLEIKVEKEGVIDLSLPITIDVED